MMFTEAAGGIGGVLVSGVDAAWLLT